MNIKTVLIIILLSLTLLSLIVISITKGPKNLPKSNIPVSSSTPASNIPKIKVDFTIKTITPPKGTILKPNQALEFAVTFDKPVDISWVGVKLTNGPINTTQLSALTFNTRLSNDNQTLTITSNPVVPLNQYNLIIINLTKNITLLNINYPSDRLVSPVASNNPTLSSFLPYETSSYKLSFNSSRNIYIFNFKYDPNSSISIDDQYNQAKSDATAFIQSKGIDINSIVIEWRHS